MDKKNPTKVYKAVGTFLEMQKHHETHTLWKNGNFIRRFFNSTERIVGGAPKASPWSQVEVYAESWHFDPVYPHLHIHRERDMGAPPHRCGGGSFLQAHTCSRTHTPTLLWPRLSATSVSTSKRSQHKWD